MDKITGKILPDGSLQLRFGTISGPNHMKAADLLKALKALSGGEVTTTKATHAHSHEQEHEHEGEHAHE